MAQVVATRLIHGAFAANPASGALQSRAEKLRPSFGFETRVLEQAARMSRRGAVQVGAPITARRSAHSEPQVIPVSPEDVPRVWFVCLFFREMLIFLGIIELHV